MSFEKKLTDPKSIPLIFEVIPPAKNIPPKELETFINVIADLVKDVKIDALDIPDLIPEKTVVRKKPLSKMPPRQLAKAINKKKKIPIIVNRVTVFDDLKKHKKWLLETWRDYKIKYLILVGAPDDKSYPGLSVTQTAKLINKMNHRGVTGFSPIIYPCPCPCPGFYPGAITIPTRRVILITPPGWKKDYTSGRIKGKEMDEPQRMIDKQKAGVQFFLSQIIYESQKTKELLKDYYQACLKEKLKPCRVFISFSPLSSERDLQFLKSLQVFIPAEIENRLLSDKQNIERNSLKEIKRIWGEISSFCQENKINIPLGVSVAYVRKPIFQASKKLLVLFNNQLCDSRTRS